ncbi:glycosyltransferase family 4 protein [Spirulina subsalsa]|uniref:glycosyltransferase family 4 protein n=1 Tax=Spirulina subsalsa TaxID=54311 RepID=UPI0002E00D01|nr:glycosyltransferase family 1 protein [Spirulina subsalsa]
MDANFEVVTENKKLVVGIDATNLRQGGGRTHLIELLRAANPQIHQVSKVVVWGSQSTLALLDNTPWLEKVNPPAQESGFLKRTLWQKFHLSDAAHQTGCDVLFVPGGSYSGNFHPVVTMSRNILPFEWQELWRYRWSLTTARLMLLRLTQSQTYRSADGVIFLTEYGKSTVEQITGLLQNTIIIPHGCSNRFSRPPQTQKPIDTYTTDQPFRILYVSIIDQYKHQWHIVEGVAKLRQWTGWNVVLELIGSAYPPALKRLKTTIQRYDPETRWVHYKGGVPFDQLHEVYQQADLGIFASSCENMPNILLEMMATGLPVASSNRRPMPEILGNAGVYFDPEDPHDIANALLKLIESPHLRTVLSNSSFTASQQYTWARCADTTFAFLTDVHQKYAQKENQNRR